MSDPAHEAAERACAGTTVVPLRGGLTVAAAREALAPIRQAFESWDGKNPNAFIDKIMSQHVYASGELHA